MQQFAAHSLALGHHISLNWAFFHILEENLQSMEFGLGRSLMDKIHDVKHTFINLLVTKIRNFPGLFLFMK